MIQTNVEGARVVIDEFEVGTTPVEPIELEPGPHTVHISRPGYTEFTDVVRMEAGEQRELPVELYPLSMVVHVETEPPAARVFVDGAFRGETPLEVELAEGEHSLRIALARHREVIRSITATPGATDSLELTLEPMSAAELGERPAQWYEEPLTWVAVGGGALVLAITIIIIAAATSSGPSQIDTFCMQASGGDCLQRAIPGW
ncbi:MAG: PEGA domain-containing protein [Sandaracinaceae bacterium]|nr:PEGA domain-containing protein [Sandaracinaceae bacterium]